MGKRFRHSQEFRDQVKKRLDEGYSYLQTGQQLGCTRNVIAGIASRAGWTKSGIERRLVVATKRTRKRPIRLPVVKADRPIPDVDAATLEPLVGNLLALGPECCKYPYGDSNFRFCGRPTVDGDVYCSAHAFVCYTSPQPRKTQGYNRWTVRR